MTDDGWAPDGGPTMRVVVCGTTFGQVYLESFGRPGLPLRLAGILARGSERSGACARHYGVPLFTDVDQLPGDVDIACVVVRGGLLGGRGVELVRRLVERGIHVLQEHPLHHDELAPPRYVDAACGFQLAYSLLDVLGQALGGVRPCALAVPAAPAAELRGLSAARPAFRGLDGVIAGVPLTLRVQNQLDPGDPDNFAHLMHRVSLGTEAGDLTLVNTHGPVIWSARPRYPRLPRDPASRPHFDGTAAGDLATPSATVIGPAGAMSYHDAFRSEWPAAVARALLQLRRAVLDGEDPLRRGQYHLTLCRLWQDIAAKLGPPELLDGAEPAALSAEQLAAVSVAAEAAAPLAGAAS